MTPLVFNDLEIITQKTVFEMKRGIRLISAHHEFHVSGGGTIGEYPVYGLNGLTISKSYCHLDYPLVGCEQHFFSGIWLEIFVAVSGQVILRFQPTNGPDTKQTIGTLGLKAWQMLLDQDTDSSRVDALKDVESAILKSLEENERGLQQHKKNPQPRLFP